MKYNITDIAKLAGVSKATVSRVLNNSKPVSDEIRSRVLEVVKETNFKPSQLARSLSSKQTKLIGVIVPDISNPVFSQIINGIEVEAYKKGYNVLLCNSNNKEDTELNYLEVLLNKEIDGLIYNGFKITDNLKLKLKEFHVPVVMTGIGEEQSNFPVIKIDNFKAANDAVSFLIQKGHKKIGMIHGPVNDPLSGKLRLEGYYQALKDNNLEVEKNFIQEGNYKISSGYKSMTNILSLVEKPTAIFCANDEMAIGAIKCIIDHGYKVPNDYSIIGFDNIELSEIYSPSLTTISQSFYNEGESAMRVIISMLNKDKHIPKEIVHDHKLIERETVKKI
ncbi:MAG: LacI family DNA-binding transcriptional regulator [Spirochaetales bacterium]|nr:LacI family DNA-binding transcriptional regulator [Spirochaetales bacterium]